MSDEVERLLIRIDATSESLRREMKRADSAVASSQVKIDATVNKINRSLARIGDTSGKANKILASLGVGLSVSGLLAFTKSALDSADAIVDLSKRTGVAGSTLLAFDYIAKLSGTSVESFASGLGKMSKTIGEAGAGVKSARESLGQLGISFTSIQNLSPEDQFVLIADRINGLGSQAQKTKATMDVFGRSGLELAGVMEGGADSIRGMLDEAKRLGLVMSQSELDKIARFNDQFDTMNARLNALARDGFLAIADMAEVASDKVNLLLGNLTAVSSFGLVEQMSKIQKKIAETKGHIDSLHDDEDKWFKLPVTIDRSGGEALPSLKRVSTAVQKNANDVAALNMEYSRLEGLLVKTQAEEKRMAEVKASLTKKFKDGAHGLRTYGDETEKTASKIEALNERVMDLITKSHSDALAVDMTKANKAALDFDATVNQLTADYAKLGKAMPASLSKGLVEARKEVIAAAEDQELKKYNEKIAEALNAPFENAARGIQNSFTDMFEGIFGGSIDSASDAAKAIKQVFIRMAAEMATLQIFGPQLAGISAGGLIGSLGGARGGGGSLLSTGSNMLSLANISGGINSAAAATGLFSSGAPISATVAGPTMQGGFGASGFTAGAAAGYAGAAVAAYMALDALGAFSGPRKHPASTFSTQGAFATPLDLQSKWDTTEFAETLAAGVRESIAALATAGLPTAFIKSIQGGVDDGKGFLSLGDYRKWNSDTIKFDPKDPDLGVAKFLKLVTESAGDLSKVMDADLIPALKGITTEGKSSADVLNEIISMLTRDDLRKELMKSVNADIMEAMAPGYGAQLEEQDRYRGQLEQAKKLGASSEQIMKIQELHQIRIRQLLQANNGEQQKQVQRANELIGRYSAVSDRFGSLLDELKFGDISSDTPTNRLGMLSTEIDSLAQRAQLGDIDAQERLANLLPAFRELSEAVNGGNAEYGADLAKIGNYAQLAKSVADRQTDIQTRILQASEETTNLLSQYLDKVGGSTGNANDLIKASVAKGDISDAEAHALIRSTGFDGYIGNGNVQSFYGANSNANMMAYALLAARGITKMAGGGIVTGGTAGADSVPAMLMPGERVFSVPHSQMLEQLAARGVNNNAEISALRQDVHKLTRVVAEYAQRDLELGRGILDTNDRMARAETPGWGEARRRK